MEECVCSCYLQVCFCVTNSQGQGLLLETVCVSHSAEPGHETRSLCVCARSVVSDSVQPHGLRPAVLPCPWDFPGKNTEVGGHFPSPGDLPYPGIEPMSPALAGGFFTTEPAGKSFKSIKWFFFFF